MTTMLKKNRVKECYRRFLIHCWHMKLVNGALWINSKYNKWHRFIARNDFMYHSKWHRYVEGCNDGA